MTQSQWLRYADGQAERARSYRMTEQANPWLTEGASLPIHGHEPGEVELGTLRAGDGFDFNLSTAGPGPRRQGFLCALGLGSATVQLLDRVHRVIRLSDGKEIPVEPLVGIQHWSLESFVVPNGTTHDLGGFLEQLKTQGGSMAAKEKTKKVPKAKVFHVVKYEAVGGKNDSKVAQKYMDAECKTHNAVIYRAVRGSRSPLTFAELLAAIDKRTFGSESKDVENIFRWHVNDLRKKGLIRSTEEKVQAASGEAARAGEGAAA